MTQADGVHSELVELVRVMAQQRQDRPSSEIAVDAAVMFLADRPLIEQPSRSLARDGTYVAGSGVCAGRQCGGSHDRTG